jgi:hypothetical protein
MAAIFSDFEMLRVDRDSRTSISISLRDFLQQYKRDANLDRVIELRPEHTPFTCSTTRNAAPGPGFRPTP